MLTTPSNFSITAKTCTLKHNGQEQHATILGTGTKYVIPIYQRPYSWSEEQISKFVSDIFTSFWGNNGNSEQEPMFIGTMQLSDKKENSYQEIIDGQQRLTTFLVLLKVLKHKFPNCAELSSISLDWLSTQVNNGKQQEYLAELIQSDLELNSETLNHYLKNAFLLNEIIEEQIKDDDGNSGSFDINAFVDHLLSNIYFVVIETKAGLSKTLQIFNAINTTGLDLNGGDIFKIKMYEYLRDKKGQGEEAFNEISRLYEMIDTYNQEVGSKVAGIQGILEIYQFILIAKYNLPATLYTFGVDTFFERLFDTIFNINQWEHFRSKKEAIELSLEDINRIIEFRYEWERRDYPTAEDSCAMRFIWWSRYSRYWKLVFVYLYQFGDEENAWEKMFHFTRQLSKVYFIYSVRFQKAINDIHSFTNKLLNSLLHGTSEEVLKVLNSKIGKLENHKNWYDLEHILKGNLTENAKMKNLVCRLSAMLDEEYQTADPKLKHTIVKNLFDIPIDIEHIQAYHDIKEEDRQRIWKEWGHEINALGNLVVLEQGINRKIKNNAYAGKQTGYHGSNFTSVKNILLEHPEFWNLETSKARKEKEYRKIVSYLFQDNLESHENPKLEIELTEAVSLN